MAKNIEPNLKLISEYLKLGDTTFVIPEYQRGYSWGINPQCDKLWQDVEVFIESDGSDPYFFGTIIVDCSEEGQLRLIDGQQRTTTFLLLLKALLLRLNEALEGLSDDSEVEGLKAGLQGSRNKIMKILYRIDDEDIPLALRDFSKIEKQPIVESNSINELHKDETSIILGSENYIEAEKNAYKIPRKQKDNKYTNQFRNFKYFYEQLGEKTETQLNKFAKVFLEKCQIIEIKSWQIEQAITMFNSLNSTGLPLSDADIISAQLYSKAGDDRGSFNEQWERIKKVASDLDQQKIVDLNAVLMQYMYIYRAIQKEYMKNDSVDVTVPGLRRYFTEINDRLLDDPLAMSEQLEKITQTWLQIKDYPIVKLLLRFNENIKLYLAGYLYRFKPEDITPETVLSISETLLRLFTVLELVDAGYSSKNFKTFLFRANIKLVDPNVSVDEIKRDFDHHIGNTWNKDDIISALKDYEKHALVYLNEYLYAKSKGLNFDFPSSVNVEHIMPASGKNIGTIRKDAGVQEVVEFNSLVNKLGNKILLEEDINKSIGNNWFRAKKNSSIEDKSGYNNSKYALAAKLTSYSKDRWEKEDIEFATDKAAERIAEFIFGADESQNTPTEAERLQIEELRAKGYI